MPNEIKCFVYVQVLKAMRGQCSCWWKEQQKVGGTIKRTITDHNWEMIELGVQIAAFSQEDNVINMQIRPFLRKILLGLE